MIYRYGISTPASTLEANKQKTILKLERGVIHQIDIDFPPGPVGLCHVHINNALHQVWPTNQGEDFAGDDVHISFREHLEIVHPPFELEVYTWNLDDTNEHTIVIRLGILARKFILKRLF